MSAADGRRLWVPVLLYHRVVPEPPARDPFGNFTSTAVFAGHLRWLRDRGYAGVPVAAVGEALLGRRELPARPVVITFDDGYLDNLTHAWPLLRTAGFPATIFVVTEAIGGSSEFDRGSGYPPAPMLSAADIRRLLAEGAEIGSHSQTHPDSLIGLDNSRLLGELTGSKAALEAILDRPIQAFSYPHSRHDARVERAVMEAGYTVACGGVGTRFEARCLSRVVASGSLGMATSWRWLKWRASLSLRREAAA